MTASFELRAYGLRSDNICLWPMVMDNLLFFVVVWGTLSLIHSLCGHTEDTWIL